MIAAKTIERARCWCRQHPITAGLLVTLAACLLVALLANSFFSRLTIVDEPLAAVLPQSGDARAGEALRGRTESEQVRHSASENWKTAARVMGRLDRRSLVNTQEDTLSVRRCRYAGDMQLVQKAWEQGRVGVVLDLLDGHRPASAAGSQTEDLRGFEWYYWNRQVRIARMRDSGTENQSPVTQAGADERQIVTESSHQTMELAKAARPEEVRTLAAHAGAVLSVAFTPDGTRLISAGRDGSVQVHSVARGTVLLSFTGTADQFRNFAFSPDGRRVATAGDNTLRVIDTDSGADIFVLAGHSDLVNGTAFSSDGGRIASASNDQSVKIWDAMTGQELLTLTGHRAGVLCVAFSPNQSCVASGSADGTLKIWDASRD
jgi:hypothetical protein